MERTIALITLEDVVDIFISFKEFLIVADITVQGKRNLLKFNKTKILPLEWINPHAKESMKFLNVLCLY